LSSWIRPHQTTAGFVNCAAMRNQWTSNDNVYTITRDMARPLKPEHLRRSKILPIRLTAPELKSLEAASRKMGVTVAEIMREGAALYIETKGKDGSRHRKENRR
jgi:hypothetical protein